MCAKQPRGGRDASLIALAMFAALSQSGPGHAVSPTQPRYFLVMYSPVCDSTNGITCNTADFLSGVCKLMGGEAEERSITITTAPSISCETKETFAGKLLLYCSLNFSIDLRYNLCSVTFFLLVSEHCGSNYALGA